MSEVEKKAQELLDALKAERRPADWEHNMRMFAGNDTRVLRRIPLLRRKQGVQNAFITGLEYFIQNIENIKKELDS